MQAFTDAILNALAAESGLDADAFKLERARDPKLGDFAVPCFPLAKALKQAPPAIAADLAAKLPARLEGITVEAAGPYLNFRIDRTALASTVIGAILDQGQDFGKSDEGHGRTIVIDLSSPNIAKPMSVGHLRSTVIGAAIQRLHDHLGYTTVGINHIGDWGSQFGKLVAAMNRWGDTVELENDPIQALLALYVRFHEEVENDPSLAEEGKEAFRELESGVDGDVRATWRKLTELSLAEFDKTYKRLGVTFDEVRGEAFYEDHLDATIERIVASGVTETSDDALVVSLTEFNENLPPCILRKSDGTTLYATRDLAALFQRWEEFSFTRCLYVVGSDQRLHFRQLKNVLKRLEVDWEPRVEHIDFGLMRLPEGKLSSRQGRVVFLEDLLDEAVEKARGIIAEKNPDLADAEDVAQAVGIGAVVFHDLKRERIKDVLFEWEDVLSFEGETGPYVQYTHARLASIEARAASQGLGSEDPDLTKLDDAGDLLLLLGRFPAVVRSAARNAEPSEITRYVLELARETNSWYANHRVLGDDPVLSRSRLALVCGAKIVIANSLRLLGIGAPEEM